MLFVHELKKYNTVMKAIKLVKSSVQYLGLFVSLYILKTISNEFGFTLPLLLSFCSMVEYQKKDYAAIQMSTR